MVRVKEREREEEINKENCSSAAPSAYTHLGILDGVLVLLEDTLLDQLFGARPVLETLFQTVSSHVHIQLLLVALEGGCCCRVGQDVAVDQLGSIGTAAEAPLEVVCCALSLELESFSLESANRGNLC